METSESVCRSCLATEDNFFRIDSVIDDCLTISDVFKIHLNINIYEDDELPQYICSECLDILLQLRKFHIKYLKSEAFLREQNRKSLIEIEENTIMVADEPDSSSNSSQFKAETYTEESSPLEQEKIEFQIEILDDDFDSNVDPDIDFLVKDETRIENANEEDPISISEVKEEDSNETTSRSKSEAKQLQCLQCKEKFINKNELRAHFHSAHGEDNANGFCIQCSSKFPTRGQLMKHLHTHVEKPRIKCGICEKLFPGRHKLITHQRTHTGEKPYVCKVCNKAFSQSSVLGTHMALHMGKQVDCPKCDKKFSRQSFLKVHLRAHDDVRPYECHLCDKKYRMKSHLNSHLLTHSDERNFSCEICGQAFKEKTILRSHMNIHTRPYKCPKCPLQAAKLYSFRLHLIKMHGIHDDPKLFMLPSTSELKRETFKSD